MVARLVVSLVGGLGVAFISSGVGCRSNSQFSSRFSNRFGSSFSTRFLSRFSSRVSNRSSRSSISTLSNTDRELFPPTTSKVKKKLSQAE